MNLTAQQKRLCEQIINVFESGSPLGNYSAISIYKDGPHNQRQVTYGRSQTTEFGNLAELLDMYVKAGGIYSEALRPYLDRIEVTPLADDALFVQLLRDAGRKDPLMRQTQDAFFDKRYFIPAMNWADNNGFSLPLSALVIYDSFIHSGSILNFLRKRFPESPPASGGDERAWIIQYVDTRQEWLANHENRILRKTVYRTACFKYEINRDNWDLSRLPINANGIEIS
ncbi:MAG: chitosanase [Deltaproteobacteria bacterium]|nr:chitosanase [Deltaproteobacteria bacterium]